MSRPVKKLGLLLGLLAAVTIATTVWFFRGDRYEFILTEGMIQDALDAKFPVDKSYLGILDLQYHDPRVDLRAGDDRIGVEMSVTLKLRLSGKPMTLGGTGLIRTGLRYDSETSRFLLNDPTVEELRIQGIPVKHVDKVNDLARKLAREHIHRIAVYDLKRRADAKHVAARLVLKGFVVEDGRVRVTLGL